MYDKTGKIYEYGLLVHLATMHYNTGETFEKSSRQLCVLRLANYLNILPDDNALQDW